MIDDGRELLHQAALERMLEVEETRPPGDVAVEWFNRGANVFPAPYGRKFPSIEWGRYQTERLTERQVRDHFDSAKPGVGVFLVTGAISDIVVLDLDDETAVRYWRGVLGDDWSGAPVVRTPSGGRHVYFRPAGAEVRNRVHSADDGRGRWDMRGEGGGVLAAGSPGYVLVAGSFDRIPDLPPSIAEALRSAPPGPDVATESGQAGTPRSGQIEDVFAGFARAVEGDRNNQLNRACLLYARNLRDADYPTYMLTVEAVVARHHPALLDRADDGYWRKTADSAWAASRREREDNEREREIAREVRRIEVREEARARVRAAEFRPPAVAMSAAALIARPLPDRRWVVDGLLGAGHNALFAAQYKAGKTHMLLNLIKSVVDGEPFLGQFETRLEGRVTLLNFELTDLDAQEWISALRFARPERVNVVCLRGEPNPFASPAGQEWLAAELRRNETELLVIDTFRASYTGDSHNDNAQVARYTATIDRIKAEAGVAGSLLSHHYGRKLHERGQEHGQGAVELDSWADVRWNLNLDGQDRFFAVTGRIDGLRESRLSFDRETRRLWIPDGALGVDRDAARGAEIEAAIIAALRAEPGATSRRLREYVKEACGAGSEACDDALKRLRRDGRVVVRTGAKNAFHHYLPEAQQAFGLDQKED